MQSETPDQIPAFLRCAPCPLPSANTNPGACEAFPGARDGLEVKQNQVSIHIPVSIECHRLSGTGEMLELLANV